MKNIVFCADGTWNNPNEDENADHSADPTNVFKLFLRLAGTDTPDSILRADEQERFLAEGGAVRQAAKYIHGVGDSHNPVMKLLGGVFGAGVIARVVRGYTFVSRNFEPGDAITLVGFSRGAYTARALGGLIASQGLLRRELTADPETAYRRGAEAWYRYRKEGLERDFSLAHLAEIVSHLPAWVSSDTLKAADLVPVEEIAAIAVWDTVGAMGFPEHAGNGKRVDAFRFANNRLSKKVKLGLHAVSLDERRIDFTPTLWEPDPGRVVQMAFAGAHADVGGGYPMEHNESGLSDIALEWMIDGLKGAGVLFNGGSQYALNPDPGGTAHQPWAHAPWLAMPKDDFGPRQIPAGIPRHPSVAARMALAAVCAEPGMAPAPYWPAS